MSKDRGKIPKREMYKIDRQWTLEGYKAAQMLNTRKGRIKKGKEAAGIRTQEEVDKILEKIESTRHLINTEPEKAKCEICARANMNKDMKTSRNFDIGTNPKNNSSIHS